MYMHYVIMLANALSKSHQFPDVDGAPMTTFSTDFRLPVALVIAV